MISVTNVGLVILVMLSNAEPHVAEIIHYWTICLSKHVKEFNFNIVIPTCVTRLIH